MTAFTAYLRIPKDLREVGFDKPLREQWIASVAESKGRAIAKRLEELPEGWKLAVSEGDMKPGEVPGAWSLEFKFIAIDPACPDPLPVPATPQRWEIFGPIRRESPNAL